jgi:hypothetical protein
VEQLFYELLLGDGCTQIFLARMESLTEALSALNDIFQVLWKHGCIRDGLRFTVRVVLREAGDP